MAAFGGPGKAVPTAGGKRGKTTKVFFPLLTPQTFLRTRLPAVARLNGGRRGHASVRRAGIGTLLCPEVTLRYPPRITVRGQTVQSGYPVAAKSSASIKGVPLEHQTPLWAPRISPRDRRESRRKGGSGVSRGEREPLVPCPLLSPPGEPGIPPPWARRLPAAEGGHCARPPRA